MIPASALYEFSQGVSCSKYVTSTCCNPVYRKVRLSEDGSYQDMYCDCGKCVTCLDRKREEMASRMFLHATNYDYVYFITLTYGSYNLIPFSFHPFLADWLQTVPTCDLHNESGHARWTPTILVQSHLNKYFKRLRKLVGSFTYCGCGEYGSKFGRPHFHAIIYSNSPISKQQFQDAWSLDCKRTNDKHYVRPWRSDEAKTKENGYFKFKIGEVQVYDLYANGSMNYDGKHPGQFTSQYKAMNNFTYVAKYLGKTDPYSAYTNLPFWVLQRIKYAYAVYGNDIDELSNICPYPYAAQIEIKNKITLSFDYHVFKNITFNDFKKIVAPFFVSSRRPSIGKRYYIENRSRFQAKEFGLPKFMGKQIAFPTYYFRLLAQDKYPIRIRKNVPSGVSHTKDLLPRVYAYFSALREDANFWFTVRSYYPFKEALEHDQCRNGIYLYQLRHCITDSNGLKVEVPAGEIDHIDFLDPSGSTIHFVYNPYDELFRGYVYNRHTGSYDLYEHYFDRIEFCDMVLDQIEDEYKDFPEKLQKMQLAFDLENAIISDCEAVEERTRYLKLRVEMQTKYKSQHINEL